jgi:mono/diheme cytochrome c family protein
MEKLPVTFRSYRVLAGALMAGALTLPLLTAAVTAAPQAKTPAAAPAKGAGDAKKGKDAFKTEGCASCHKTKDYQDPNASVGPDLSAVAKDHTSAQLTTYIQHPKAGSVMPAFKVKDAGTKATLANLVAYLMTQK